MTEEIQYDVFLSHNSQDKPAVERLACQLADEAGLRPFLDKWHLVPGEPWQEALEEALDQSRTCAVFIGPRGISPWEHEEMRAAVEQRVADRDFRVIPVLLPGAERGERGRLPAFLARTTWVEFRESLNEDDTFRRLVAGIKGIPPGRRPDDEVVYKGVCPYRGLQVFEEEHAPFFLGREAATGWLVNDLRGSRFLAVVGPSGSGKSSLVRAGLVPALRRGDLPGSETWPLCVFRPGHRPLESLAVALIQLVGPADDPTAPLQLMDALAADQRQLHLTTRLALTDAPAEHYIALVVDQFEEIFTLCRDEGQRGPFIDNLLYASAVEGGRTVVVLTTRADFYGKCAVYPDLAARFTDHQMLVSPMVEEELRQAIERPAQLVGLEFEGGLVETLLRDVGAEPGALPLLQHTLLELWERREGHRLTFAAYREIGGVQGAIAHRAESIYADFDAVQQAITRRVMLRLTQPGEGTEDTRRRARKSELLPTGEQAEQIEAVIQTLADARLVTTARDMATGEEQVDVSHEALIRGWPRLREWIDEDRAGLLTHRRLTEAAEEWERLGRDKSVLYHGVRLAEAEEWVRTHPDDPNPLEREFLNASFSLRRGEQRRQWLLMAGALMAALILGLLAFIAFQQRNATERERRIALSRQLAFRSALPTNALDVSLLLSLEALHAADTFEAHNAILTALLQTNPQIKWSRRGHTGVHCVAFSPDGKTLASGGKDKIIILWDTETGQLVGQPLIGCTDVVYSVAFSPDGKTLASGSEDGTIMLWDTETGQPLGQSLTGQSLGQPLAGRPWVNSVSFSPDGKTLASGSGDGTIMLWDIETGQPLTKPLAGHSGEVRSVVFSLDGKTLAAGSQDGTIMLWDAETGQLLTKRHTGEGRSVAFSPDGKILASGGEDGTIMLWDTETEQSLGQPLVSHTGEVWSVAFSPDGKTLASGSEDGTIMLWDTETGQPLGQPLTGHSYWVNSVAFSPDGKTFVSGSGDGTIIVWDTEEQLLGQSLVGHPDVVQSVAFSPDGKTLASGSWDGNIILWDTEMGKLLGQPLVSHTGEVWSVAFSPDGKTLASGSWDGNIILWDTETGQLLGQPLVSHTGRVWSVAFSPDGKTLASGSEDGTIMLWDTETGQPLGQPLTGHTGQVRSVAFSPDGKTLASGSADYTVILWDTETGQPLSQPLTGHSYWVNSVAFSPDGKIVASGGVDTNVFLWDTETGQSFRQLQVGPGIVYNLAFSPDGKILAFPKLETIILWDTETGQPLGQPLTGHTSSVNSVAFSPDRKTLASGSSDGTIILWNLDLEWWKARACRIANRNMTAEEWKRYMGDESYRLTCPNLPPHPSIIEQK